MNKTAVRVYLLLFFAAIVGWLVVSSVGFAKLTGARGNEIPDWLRLWPPLGRLAFVTLTTNLPYFFIAFGLFLEFLRPKIEWRWSGNKFLFAIGLLLIANALVVGWNNGLFFGNLDGLIDTVIYGLGFGLLFLLAVPERSTGLSIALWARLIEVVGMALGYFFLPGVLDLWRPGYVLGHVAYGPLFMFTNYYFWTDNITAVGSLIGVVILLRQFRFSRFWITSFIVGGIITGFVIALTILGTTGGLELPRTASVTEKRKVNIIRLESPLPRETIKSPLAVRGEARGYWFFEASFPVILTDWDGRIIAETFASAEGEWMTEELVPFSAIVEFKNPVFPGADKDHFSRRGFLILQKDNPSDLPEYDDALEIPVFFKAE